MVSIDLKNYLRGDEAAYIHEYSIVVEFRNPSFQDFTNKITNVQNKDTDYMKSYHSIFSEYDEISYQNRYA